MKRRRVNDTEPMLPPFDPTEAARPPLATDPGSPGLVLDDDAPPLTTEEDMLKAEQLIGAFKRSPQRPIPAGTERAYSEGGNAVAYGTTTRAAPRIRPIEEREKVLVALAELARAAPEPIVSHAWMSSPEPVDAPDAEAFPTAPSIEKRRGRRRRYLRVGVVVVVSASAVLIPVALHNPSQHPATLSAASPPAARPPPVTSIPIPEPPTPTPTPTRETISTRDTPAANGASPRAPPAIRDATFPSPRPIGSVGAKSDPHWTRPPESHLEPTAAPAASTPLKDQFWE